MAYRWSNRTHTTHRWRCRRHWRRGTSRPVPVCLVWRWRRRRRFMLGTSTLDTLKLWNKKMNWSDRKSHNWSLDNDNGLSQHTTKPYNIRLVQPAKTQISLRNPTVWFESSLTHVPSTVSRLYKEGWFCLFVLRFYGPVNPMGSCQVRSVYLTKRLLGRLSPLSG